MSNRRTYIPVNYHADRINDEDTREGLAAFDQAVSLNSWMDRSEGEDWYVARDSTGNQLTAWQVIVDQPAKWMIPSKIKDWVISMDLAYMRDQWWWSVLTQHDRDFLTLAANGMSQTDMTEYTGTGQSAISSALIFLKERLRRLLSMHRASESSWAEFRAFNPHRAAIMWHLTRVSGCQTTTARAFNMCQSRVSLLKRELITKFARPPRLYKIISENARKDLLMELRTFKRFSSINSEKMVGPSRYRTNKIN